jgi:hypothetical protein
MKKLKETNKKLLNENKKLLYKETHSKKTVEQLTKEIDILCS